MGGKWYNKTENVLLFGICKTEAEQFLKNVEWDGEKV
jgi:hypothetical protein